MSLMNCFEYFPDVDFSVDMIFMHGFATASNSEYIISVIIYDGEKMLIEYGAKKHGKVPSNASMPSTKWLITKIRRVSIEKLDFKFIKNIR